MRGWALGVALAFGSPGIAAAQDTGCLDDDGFLDWSMREALCDADLMFRPDPAIRPDLLAMRGYLRAMQYDYGGAEEDARMALGLRPDVALAHSTLAWIALQRGDVAEGQRLAQTAYAYDPAALGVTEVLAWSLWHEGLYDECLRRADEAMGLDPGKPGPHQVRAACLSDLGRHEEAIASLDAAQAAGGDAAWIASLRSWALFSLGRHDEAEAFAREALDATPGDVAALRTLVRAVVETSGAAAALAEWEARGGAVSTADADAFGIRNNLAWTLYLAGDLEAAGAMIDAWAADHPVLAAADPNVVDTLAHVRAARGDAEGAARAFAEVARLGGEEWRQLYRDRLSALGIEVGEGGLKAALAACAALGPDCRLY